jgi:iron complex transport system substrate-binding protein
MKKYLSIIIFAFGCFGVAFSAESGSPPDRIISLAPSTTEILFALGLGDRIVGVTTFCDYPAEAKAKAKIGGMSNPSLEAIVTLKPDLVVMTMDGNPREVDERLRSMKIHTYVFNARTLAELPQGIREMGAAVGVKDKADRLAREIETAVYTSWSRGIGKEAGYKGQGAGSTGQAGRGSYALRTPHSELHRTKVLFIVWPEPLIVAGPGTAIGDAIDLLGLENTAARTKTTYPRYSIEEVIRQAPDVLFIGKGSGMDMRTVSKGILNKLSSVPAVKNGAVCYVSDSLYRLGPRVAQGIEELSECVSADH